MTDCDVGLVEVIIVDPERGCKLLRMAEKFNEALSDAMKELGFRPGDLAAVVADLNEVARASMRSATYGEAWAAQYEQSRADMAEYRKIAGLPNPSEYLK